MLYRGPVGGGAASGKMGAMVASHNKGGQYLRARTTPTNPRTALQNAVRGAFTSIASMWQSLTGAQRSGWQAWGIAVPGRNRLGDSIPLSGIAAFQRANGVRVQAGEVLVIDAPPAPLAQAPSDGVTQNIAFTYGDTSGTITLSGTAFPLSTNSNNFYAVYVSPPFSLGRTTAPGNTRLAATFPGDVGTGSHTFALPWAVSGSLNQMEATLKYETADGFSAGPFRLTVDHS